MPTARIATCLSMEQTNATTCKPARVQRGLNNNTVGSNAMDLLKHLPSAIAPTFSEALRIDTRAGSWIFISGQVGVQLPPEKGSVTF